MPFSTNYRCPPVTIMLSWQHARWKGRLDKAWNKVCIAERECCTFHLCVRPNLFSRMGDKWSIISLLPSLPWPICGSRLAGHLCCCPAVSRAAPTSLHTAPFLQNGLPFNNNQMAFFLHAHAVLLSSNIYLFPFAKILFLRKRILHEKQLQRVRWNLLFGLSVNILIF